MAQKIIELEVPNKNKYKYIPPHEHRKFKEHKDGQVNEILSIILRKVKKHDRVLKEIKEHVSILNHMTASHSLYIQLLETQLGHVLSHIHLGVKSEWGLVSCHDFSVGVS